MPMVQGTLHKFTVTTEPPVKSVWYWSIDLQFGDPADSPTVGTTDSAIVLAVLETALLTRWEVEVETSDDSPRRDPTIKRVRVVDDRPDFCTEDMTDPPGMERLKPLTPTAFADECPPKWGFFFNLPGTKKCREYKGISLDVFAIVQGVWLGKGTGKTVVLTLDQDDMIVDAKAVP
jgi:hypothetical protein